MTEQQGASLRVEVDDLGAVVVHGDIDASGGILLDDFLAERPPPAPTLIDLADVDFIDSSGLRTLLLAARRTHAEGSTLRLRDVGTAVRRVLDITGTIGQFDLVQS